MYTSHHPDPDAKSSLLLGAFSTTTHSMVYFSEASLMLYSRTPSDSKANSFAQAPKRGSIAKEKLAQAFALLLPASRVSHAFAVY